MINWRQHLQALAGRFGYEITRKSARLENVDAGFDEASAGLEPFTMTSRERMHALYQAILYLERERIPGALVECGVWRGGSMMLACRTLCRLHSLEREVKLFDTYEGMTEPSVVDLDVQGQAASSLLATEARTAGGNNIWCYATLSDVRANVLGTGYPQERCEFVVGRVEDTLPRSAPQQIALLRLDTDWYASTKHELEHLFPLLADGAVLIIDDYGHWRGARKAVDEYLAEHAPGVLLWRIDQTGRVGVIPRRRP